MYSISLYIHIHIYIHVCAQVYSIYICIYTYMYIYIYIYPGELRAKLPPRFFNELANAWERSGGGEGPPLTHGKMRTRPTMCTGGYEGGGTLPRDTWKNACAFYCVYMGGVGGGAPKGQMVKR